MAEHTSASGPFQRSMIDSVRTESLIYWKGRKQQTALMHNISVQQEGQVGCGPCADTPLLTQRRGVSLETVSNQNHLLVCQHMEGSGHLEVLFIIWGLHRCQK